LRRSLQIATPSLSEVAVHWNPANAVFQGQMVKEVEAIARVLGIHLQMLAARDANEILRADQVIE